ncbi:MAG: radical SAM/SPASM domain-containing protein [Candidatus Bruticola sp.]
MDFQPLKRCLSFAKMVWGTAGSICANRAGRLFQPRMAHFMLSWKCNLKCVMCSVWKKERFIQARTSDFLRLIDNLPALDIIKVSGGEPFLRPDCTEIISHMQKRLNPYCLVVMSNGTMTDRLLDFAQQCGRPGLHIRLSLEGRGKIHDKLRGCPGAFDKTMASLEALLPIMRRRRFTIGINYNIAPETESDLPWILDLCHREKLNFIPGFWVWPFLEPGRPEDSRALIDDLEAFGRRLENIYKQNEGLSFWEAFLLRRTVKRLYAQAQNSVSSKRFTCLANRSILYIMPDGSLATCGLRQEPLANLAFQNFAEVWQSGSLERARQLVSKCAGCCQYSLKIMSSIYNGEILGLPAFSDRHDLP